MKDFFQSDIVLENEIVKLVPFSESFENGLQKIIFDTEITRYTSHHILTNDDLKRYITRTLARREEGASYPFIVIHKPSGQVAGSTRFGNIVFQCRYG